MPLSPNANPPLIMHIDLNSCFARVEQQANPLLRGKPVGVAAYATPNGAVLSPSVEAKKLGVKGIISVRDARLIAPGIVIRQSDPLKYRHVHRLFKKIFEDYSPDVTPKSIDEAVIDLSHTPILRKLTPIEVALDIKRRMREEIGEWISCSIGIATNRFLAKVGAGLDKPDGLSVIEGKELEELYGALELIDLPGINEKYRARLNASGIYTSLDFYNADPHFLSKQVFQSIVGHHWHMRLRGWEADDVKWERKTVGHTYALGKKTADPKELSKLLMKLSEKTGCRLRGMGMQAMGVDVSLVYTDRTHWHMGKMLHTPVYATQEIFRKALLLMNRQPQWKNVAHIAITCYALRPAKPEQPALFETEREKERRASEAMDAINDKYGEFVITGIPTRGVSIFPIS